MTPVTEKELQAARAISSDPVIQRQYSIIRLLAEPTVFTRTEAEHEALRAAIDATQFLPGAPGFRTFF